MAVTVKITKEGYYFVGDGPCFVDSKLFADLFEWQIDRARACGLNAISFNDAEIAQSVKNAALLNADGVIRTYQDE